MIFRQQKAVRGRGRRWMALAAIAVVLLFSSLQAAHGHLPGGTEDAHCAFCLAAHSVAAVVVVAALPLLIAVQSYRALAELPFPRTPISQEKNFIRPPPMGC